jgi:hypothetical protein
MGRSSRVGWRIAIVAAMAASLLSGCFGGHAARPPVLFDVPDGGVYGPVLPPPILIRLGQSLIHASGSVGPTDGPQGSPAIWEGHGLSLEPDAERNRNLYFFVEGEQLSRVMLQVNDQPPVIEDRPGVYMSGELSMVRWAQVYSLRVTAENKLGESATAAIHVNGEDARVEGDQQDPPLRLRMLRLGGTETRNVRGAGFSGKFYRHGWPTCGEGCDLTAPGGVLIAMVSGPTDTLAVIFDGSIPYFATGLSYWPNPSYVIIAIPVRDESLVDVAALSLGGELALGTWSRPPSS